MPFTGLDWLTEARTCPMNKSAARYQRSPLAEWQQRLIDFTLSLTVSRQLININMQGTSVKNKPVFMPAIDCFYAGYWLFLPAIDYWFLNSQCDDARFAEIILDLLRIRIDALSVQNVNVLCLCWENVNRIHYVLKRKPNHIYLLIP